MPKMHAGRRMAVSSEPVRHMSTKTIVIITHTPAFVAASTASSAACLVIVYRSRWLGA